jgi:hypothetical protein
MKAKIAILGAASAALLSIATFAAPAHAQRYDYYGRTVTRCDSDGDRCATFRCDPYGDACYRVSGWYARSRVYAPRYTVSRYYDKDGYLTVRRCNVFGNCVYYQCDDDGENCSRI